ncbi:MAG TPA: hypothetical protein VHF58_08100 [Solirubrobacterales bacterium]|nr:hypothetical protein [Solirubrobacterales bacterium]
MTRRTRARYDDRYDDRWQASPYGSDGRRDRPGPRIGSIRITPVRVFLVLALIGSLAYLAFAILVVRDTSAIPMLTAGAVVLGIVFVLLGITGARGMNRAGVERRDRDAILLAVGSGLAVAIGFGCFAGAAILALVIGSA